MSGLVTPQRPAFAGTASGPELSIIISCFDEADNLLLSSSSTCVSHAP